MSSAVLLGHFTPSPRSPRDDDFRVKNDEKCALCAKRAAFIFYVAVVVFAGSFVAFNYKLIKITS